MALANLSRAQSYRRCVSWRVSISETQCIVCRSTKRSPYVCTRRWCCSPQWTMFCIIFNGKEKSRFMSVKSIFPISLLNICTIDDFCTCFFPQKDVPDAINFYQHGEEATIIGSAASLASDDEWVFQVPYNGFKILSSVRILGGTSYLGPECSSQWHRSIPRNGRPPLAWIHNRWGNGSMLRKWGWYVWKRSSNACCKSFPSSAVGTPATKKTIFRIGTSISDHQNITFTPSLHHFPHRYLRLPALDMRSSVIRNVGQKMSRLAFSARVLLLKEVS